MKSFELPQLDPRFGPIRQVAYLVRNLDEAIEELHREHGMGPFLVARNEKPLTNARFRGEPCDSLTIHLGYVYVDGMQIELVEWVASEPSIYKEALDALPAGESGLNKIHHYAVCVADFRPCYRHAMNNGYAALVDSGIEGLAQMSYIQSTEQPELIVELIQWNAITQPYFDKIEQLVANADPAQLIHEFTLSKLTPLGAVARLGGKLLWNKLLRRSA